MTTNKYWLFLEKLLKSGVTNMWEAAPYIQREFGVPYGEAKKILIGWIKNYNQEDYEE